MAFTYTSLGFSKEHYSWGNLEQHKIPVPFASMTLNF